VESKFRLIEARIELWLPGAGELGKWGDDDQGYKLSSYAR